MAYFKIDMWAEDTIYVKALNKEEAIEKAKEDCCDEFMFYSAEKITKKDYYDETMLDEDGEN